MNRHLSLPSRRSGRWTLLATVAAVLISIAMVQASTAAGAAGSGTPAGSSARPVSAPATVLPVMACSSMSAADLTGLRDAPTSVTSARLVAASNGSPEYCSITGYVAPQIQFEVRLPTQTWNGRYFQAGCGGFCGSIPISSCTAALNSDFAVAAENSGHVGSDALWAFNDTQLQFDFAYRSPHVVSIAAKALIKHFYGTPAKYSYFQGCSTGGRQALMEAQRYPDDFDGIIAGDPANRQNYLPIAQGWVETANRDSNGHLILTNDKLPILNSAVLAACDAIDGRSDGVLDDPRKCHFDPKSIRCSANQDPQTCLSAAQVDVVRKFYDGPTTSNGRSLFPGLPKGSELGWAGSDIGTDTSLSGAGNYALQVLRYLAFPKDPGPAYQLSDFNLNKDVQKLNKMAKVYNSDNPDMSAFRRSGGKLILYHGFADPLITPYSSTSYYDEATRRSGGLRATQSWFRMFLLPGIYHCTGGPGAGTVDWLTSIQAWVEDGNAPATVTAQKIVQGQVTDTRVLRPYPASPLS